MPADLSDSDLLVKVQHGDQAARQQLFNRHRGRLKKVVSIRLDKRLAARLDPSDVVQETLFEAALKLERYLTNPALPFYAWLRQIALDRVSQLHEQHVRTQKRSVRREENPLGIFSDASIQCLATAVAGAESSPINRLAKKELRAAVRHALDQLREQDREVLVLRFMEGLSVRETAEILGIREGGVNMRQLRALERLRDLLESDRKNDD